MPLLLGVPGRMMCDIMYGNELQKEGMVGAVSVLAVALPVLCA